MSLYRYDANIPGNGRVMSRDKEIVKVAEMIRMQLIISMDLFQEWGKRSYKNTNDLKHENTSDIVSDMATRIATHLVSSDIRSADGFEVIGSGVDIVPRQWGEE